MADEAAPQETTSSVRNEKVMIPQVLAEAIFILLPVMQNSIARHLCNTRQPASTAGDGTTPQQEKDQTHLKLVAALLKMIAWGDDWNEEESYWKRGTL